MKLSESLDGDRPLVFGSQELSGAFDFPARFRSCIDVVVRDTNPQERYVAIKVLTVGWSILLFDSVAFELDVCKLVTQTNPSHPGYDRCVLLRDNFIENSVHGSHLCLVTEPLGSDLMELRRNQPRKIFTIPTTKKIIKQTLLALDYLHRDCKTVHAGKYTHLVFCCDYSHNRALRCQTRQHSRFHL